MHFCLIDRVLELHDDRIVTIKAVTAAEEYLRDHFEGFPVLPGVMMIEAMVQAGRRLVESRSDLWADADRAAPLVLGGARAVKYGRFVRPGDVVRVEAELRPSAEPGPPFAFDGRVLLDPEEPGGQPQIAASGRFSLRPLGVVSGMAGGA